MKKFNIREFSPENKVYELTIEGEGNGYRNNHQLFLSKQEVESLKNILTLFWRDIKDK